MATGTPEKCAGQMADVSGDVRDRELLAKHNITHILSIHDTAAPILKGRPHLTVLLEDSCGSVCPRGPRGFCGGAVISGQSSFCPLGPWAHHQLSARHCPPKEMTYLCLPAADASKQSLNQFFKDRIIFIHESILKGKGCLVRCVAGVSCSVALVVVNIMTVTGRG
ncbi:dual specificity protein phosphatase 22-B-like [Salvelinus alpinus]